MQFRVNFADINLNYLGSRDLQDNCERAGQVILVLTISDILKVVFTRVGGGPKVVQSSNHW